MYGTVSYFTERLREIMMNNLVVDHASTLQVCYSKLKQEIRVCAENEEKEESYLVNFEKAFASVRGELLGYEEEFDEYES
jgi:hypothetical protein